MDHPADIGTERSATGGAALDPVRRLILERVREERLTLAHLSRALERNESYMHQFVYRGSPRRLPEDARATLADLLQVPEDMLRGMPKPDGKARSHGGPVGRGHREALLPVAGQAHPGPDIPVYSDDDKIAPENALEWTWRPSRLSTAKGAFALWISRPRGRLRAGDLAYVRIGQPVRLGDTVVALLDDRVAAVGDLVAMDDQHAEVRDGDEPPLEFERGAVRLLKVVCADFA